MTAPTIDGNYQRLDDAIVKAISNGAVKFYQICAAIDEVVAPESAHPSIGDVHIRLQALSKQHRIRYWRGKWEVL